MSQSNASKPRLPLKDLRKRLAGLRQLDLQHADIEFLKKQLAPILHHYVHAAPLIQPGERIFRAVLWPEPPSAVAQLTYPPTSLVPRYGRVNRPGESVFYGSVGSTAAIQELAPADGARMALAMWRVTKPTPAVSVGYSEEIFAKLGSDRWAQVWWCQPVSVEPFGLRSPENRALNAFLAREFTRRVPKGSEWQYKLTVAIAEAFFKGKPASAENLQQLQRAGVIPPEHTPAGLQAPALIYPSIATAANADNIALKCEAADSALELAWVQYIEIGRPTGKADEFTPNGLDFAESIDGAGSIQWRGEFPNAMAPGSDLWLALDGGALVLKDSLGRVAGKFPEAH